MRFRSGWSLLAVATAAMAGCAEEEAGNDQLVLQALDHDLTVGAKGVEARAVNAYLDRFGYFPNDRLARLYPTWRSIVAQTPLAPDDYDERTAEGVRALQRNAGLVETGIIDADTRALLVQPRCGFPDGVEPLEGSEKFALGSGEWDTTSIGWSVTNTNDVTIEQARAAAANALAEWAGPTNYTFAQSSLPHISVTFSSKDHNGDTWPSNVLGASTLPSPSIVFPFDGGDVRLNTAFLFSTTTPPGSGAHDLQSLLAHELGHAIGLTHSSISVPTPAVMRSGLGAGTMRRTLTPDDRMAGFARSMAWEAFDTASDDIAIQDGQGGQVIWVTGGATVAGGREIWSLSSTGWHLWPNGAERIASNDRAGVWAVQTGGGVLRFNGTRQDWDVMNGCARDIAVGPDNSVWIISCETVLGGRLIKKWNGSQFVAESNRKGASRIAVGPQRPGGVIVPWVVDQDGKIFRRSSGDVASGTWETIGGTGKDIAVGASGHAWLIGATSVNGGFSIHVWNEQDAGGGSPAAPKLAKWIRVAGGALNITADIAGTPFVVNDARTAFRTK